MFFVALFSTYANETKTTIWNDFVSKVSFGGNAALLLRCSGFDTKNSVKFL